MVLANDKRIQYYGAWQTTQEGAVAVLHNQVCEVHFTGGHITAFAEFDPDAGSVSIQLDEELPQIVSLQQAQNAKGTLFSQDQISGKNVHTLRIKTLKSQGSVCLLGFEGEGIIDYRIALRDEWACEMASIDTWEEKVASDTTTFVPVAPVASFPSSGVKLLDGLFKDAFESVRKYVKFSAEFNPYTQYTKDQRWWFEWLPLSAIARVFWGASNSLKWQEDAQMRTIAEKYLADIKAHTLQNGYWDYYPAWDSYALDCTINTERKNYDRTYLTRALFAAADAGYEEQALPLIRGMYDWLNEQHYRAKLLRGNNYTNAFPAYPLLYESSIGVPKDMEVYERFIHLESWAKALADGQSMAIAHMPGFSAHCYELLCLEAFIRLYRSTGNKEYWDTSIGFWNTYRQYFCHLGGAAAICEGHPPYYPPGSYRLTSGHNGETCGTVFWTWVSNLLWQHDPKPQYQQEIEEGFYNVMLSAMDQNQYPDRHAIRYHNRYHGQKAGSEYANTCCEVNSTGYYSDLPALVFGLGQDAIYINQYTAAELSVQSGGGLGLNMKTQFPFEEQVVIRTQCDTPISKTVHVRIPSWVTSDVDICVNQSIVQKGKAGEYVIIQRTWQDGDEIQLKLPMTLRAERYEGIDIGQDNGVRYAFFYGPIILAFVGNMASEEEIPSLGMTAEEAVRAIQKHPEQPLHFTLHDFEIMPYYQIAGQWFTSYPTVKD